MNTNVGLQALKWPYLGRILSELSDSKCVGSPAGPKSARKLIRYRILTVLNYKYVTMTIVYRQCIGILIILSRPL